MTEYVWIDSDTLSHFKNTRDNALTIPEQKAIRDNKDAFVKFLRLKTQWMRHAIISKDPKTWMRMPDAIIIQQLSACDIIEQQLIPTVNLFRELTEKDLEEKDLQPQ